MFVIAELIELFVEPFVWAFLMNTIQQQGITSVNIWKLIALLVLTFVGGVGFWVVHGPARIMERTNAFMVRTNYRRQLLKGILTMPMEWHVEHHSGDTIDKVQRGTNALYDFSGETFEIIYSIVELIGCYIVLVYFSRPAAFLVLGMLLVSGWITTRFDRTLVVQYKELNRAENQVSESIFDAISNITTVIILRVEGLVFNAIMRKAEEPFKLTIRNSRLDEMKWFLTSVCCSATTVVVLGVYFLQHTGTSEGVLIGNVYLLIQYLQQRTSPTMCCHQVGVNSTSQI